MKLRLMLVAVVAAAATIPAQGFAHHSFAMFDRTKQVVLVGTVKEFQWTNPHSWIQIDVPTPGKDMVEWSIEGGSPNSLSRRGWSRTSLKPGDRVTLTINPLKDGKNGGSFISATMPDGSKLGGGAADRGPAGDVRPRAPAGTAGDTDLNSLRPPSGRRPGNRVSGQGRRPRLSTR